MNLAVAPQFQSVQEGDDRFLALFPHRHDYIWAEHSNPGQKPDWQTESRHPLSDRLIRQGSTLYGVRFGPKTHYILFDIDSNSLYHPRRDPFAISRLVAALEPLGLIKYIACTSSYSGGIHLYFPFEQAQDSYKLARVIQVLLENAGFIFSPGLLEIFPNDRGFVDGIPALYAAHRLPMQAGSYLLNSSFDILWSDQTTFVQGWQFAQQHNQLAHKTLAQIFKTAKRKKYRISGKANKFLNDLVTEIYQGWTGFGQTNRILGRIAMYCYIFWHSLNGCAPLEGRSLVRQIVEIAKSLPGYTEFCRHQHEIEQRAEEWATCVESSHYYPYGIGKNQPTSPSDPEQSSPTWHEQKQEDARERIRQAIAQLLDTYTLPAKPTARFNALVKQGIGGATLYKHKDLWHPEYLIPVDVGERQSNPPPPHPPGFASGRTEDAPECPNLLVSQSSNAPLDKDLEHLDPDKHEGISSNTQFEPEGQAWAKHQVAAIQALQAYKRAAQQEAWEQFQLLQPQPSQPSLPRLAQMQQWLESGDPILVAEAEAFFNAVSSTTKSTD
jgi:hypothetical protein